MREKVQAVLDKVRPMLQADGGDVELVDVQDGIVKVRLQGACAGCPMSQMTLRNGIERALKQAIPEIKAVESAEQKGINPKFEYRNSKQILMTKRIKL